MYVLISGINSEIGGFKRFKPVLLGNVWSGLAEVSKAEAEELLKYPAVKEISPEVAEFVKKKVNGEAIAYRSFRTHQQEATQNPNAVYAEKVEVEVKEDPKELLKVEAVEVDRPLEDKPAPTKTKSKAKGKGASK